MNEQECNKQLKLHMDSIIDYFTTHNFNCYEGSMFVFYLFKNIKNSETYKNNEFEMDIKFRCPVPDFKVDENINISKMKLAYEYMKNFDGLNIYIVLSIMINLTSIINFDYSKTKFLIELDINYNVKMTDNLMSHDMDMIGINITYNEKKEVKQ